MRDEFLSFFGSLILDKLAFIRDIYDKFAVCYCVAYKPGISVNVCVDEQLVVFRGWYYFKV